MKVLLVDDEVEFVSTLAERLSIRGIKADDVTSGQDAINKIRSEEAYNVIVLDLKMGGLDGFETMKQIQKIKPETAFIILSGHCSDEEYEKMLSAGASDYLIKPIDIESLVEKIHKVGTLKRSDNE